MKPINEINDPNLRNLLIKFDSLIHIYDSGFYKLMPDDTSREAIIVKTDLANYMYKQFVTPRLIKSFNINKNFKYYRMQEIANCLATAKASDDLYFIFKNLIWTESADNMYDEMIKFIEPMSPLFDKNILNEINKFAADPINFDDLYSGKSEYLPLPDEKRVLSQFLAHSGNSQNKPPLEFIKYNNEYRQDQRKTYMKDEDEIRRDINNGFQFKHTGNIGEYYTQDILASRGCNPKFIAKYYGDTFGYDHHLLYSNEENLIDSKATLVEANSFKIGPTEFKVLEDSIDQKFRKYYISRLCIFRDTLNLNYAFFLKPLDPLTFVPATEHNNYSMIWKFSHDDEKGKKVYVKQQKRHKSLF